MFVCHTFVCPPGTNKRGGGTNKLFVPGGQTKEDTALTNEALYIYRCKFNSLFGVGGLAMVILVTLSKGVSVKFRAWIHYITTSLVGCFGFILILSETSWG